jgi:hypothetical protein
MSTWSLHRETGEWPGFLRGRDTGQQKMFIKPLETSALPQATWTDHSGNLYFTLQSRKARGLFASLSLAQVPQAVKRISEFEFRILLKTGGGKKTQFVVAVDDSFEKMHGAWTWIEQNVFLRLLETSASLSPDQIDAVLLKQFEDLAEEAEGISFILCCASS